MASFLSDPLTQSQASTVETFFRLGLAAEQSREQAAAAQAAHEKDILVTQQAEQQRQLAVRAAINEEKSYEANLKAKEIASQSAEKFTENEKKTALSTIARRESIQERQFGPILNNPKYSPETHASVQNYLSGLYNAGSGAIGQINSLKPGQAADLSDYEQTVSKLPIPSYSLEQGYENKEQSETTKNLAQAHKYLTGKGGRGGGGGSVSKDAGKYSDALIKYNSVNDAFQNKTTTATHFLDAKVGLKQKAAHLYDKFKSNPSSVVSDPNMRAIISHYASEGNPFDPDEQQNVLGELSKEYDNQSDPGTKNLLQKTYQYLSGRSLKSNYIQTSSVPVSAPATNSALTPLPLIPSTFAPMR